MGLASVIRLIVSISREPIPKHAGMMASVRLRFLVNEVVRAGCFIPSPPSFFISLVQSAEHCLIGDVSAKMEAS
jgi:hypothetical protein